MYNFINFDVTKNIAVAKINRPKALNALNTEVLKELGEVVNDVKVNQDIKVLIITGEGRAFVAGADIAEMKDMTAEEAKKFSNLGNKVFRGIETLDIPVIAAVNGFALGGGCELAMSCDIRIASEKAKFGQPEVGLGITPGFGGTQRLARLVGNAKAKELIFTADIIRADEAEKIGLVNKLVKPEELEKTSLEMAEKIASKGRTAVKHSKESINKGSETDIETAISIEESLFGLCFSTEDQEEGMAAFLEKRTPDFK